MRIPYVLYAGDYAAGERDVLPANRIANRQHVILHMRRLAYLHGRNVRHELWIVNTDKRKIRVVVREKDRGMIEGVFVLLADAYICRIGNAMGASEDSPVADYDAGADAAVRVIGPGTENVRLGRREFKLYHGVDGVVSLLRRRVGDVFLLPRGKGRGKRGRYRQHRESFN